MTEARVEKVHADRLGARTDLDQAERFDADAAASVLSAESQSVLLHDAAIAAANGILQAAGLRVTAGDRSHVLRFETALAQLPQDTEDLLERLEATRSRRNEASYASMLVAQASVDEAREAVAELIAPARSYVD